MTKKKDKDKKDRLAEMSAKLQSMRKTLRRVSRGASKLQRSVGG